MRANAIVHLDTAASYGDAESRIGNLDTTGIHIQTKLSAKNRTYEELRSQLHESLTELKTESVNSLLIHDWFTLDQNEIDSVSQFFELSMNEGLTHHVGISAYNLSDLDRAKDNLIVWDTAQIPINALDQRFVKACELFPGIAFQARSIFLQGLLLASNPDHVDVIRFHKFSQSLGVDPLTLSLQFIKEQSWLDSVIIAPTSLHEFDQILGAANSHIPDIDFYACVSLDAELLDPRTWN
jgi:aryl-alcohol dehydrogenase-like predicted oxidoreductase